MLFHRRSTNTLSRYEGIRIAMDDFGVGYSSLGNMRELPIDIGKIDRSFINRVSTDSYSKSFMRLISDLVHPMEKKVCIEVVETEEQLKYCRECGADYMQGFLSVCRGLPTFCESCLGSDCQIRILVYN